MPAASYEFAADGAPLFRKRALLRRTDHMTTARKLLLLPGDGVGPEVMQQVRRIIDWLEAKRGIRFDLSEGLVGGAAIDAQGTPLADETLAAAKAADAVLFGSVGGPQWDKLGFDMRPEIAILRLRSELGLFANLRPAKVFDALVDASTLKADVVRGLDIMIVRESTGGVYFGEPRGIETLPDGTKRGFNTETYSTMEIQRVARVAFDLARARDNRVTSVEKCNVMESGLLWRQVVTELHAAEYADVTLSHMLADNCAMQLARNPRQFDVILTGNLFGDILSDLASMLTGSLGMLPSATLGARDADGRRPALYEPIHGSAPDIAGKGIANPLGQILSFSMLLRYSFDLHAEADLIEQACSTVLNRNVRTADIAGSGMASVSTRTMGDNILAALDEAL
ncbi:3-isopropylmalate dehydrogenase [Granulibacter bethesdensis CGDNIH1]|uniref:3-isopropylmalate dehydrogenase n=2 Tax=Granulibacter bethesdensis TaxID=364410 RepID=Q0BRH6_GRABC|nr:3-isopropylmalate dehydrogenase [Granulibacter bethesdensis CGDNIH1]APH52427.1 3-isopropylmalate dehydrogenase [Granulibacter bethesdensis]APH65117.1 3-isopropylmalate dehydrogenase [Granulibacter bethesdensis]